MVLLVGRLHVLKALHVPVVGILKSLKLLCVPIRRVTEQLLWGSLSAHGWTHAAPSGTPAPLRASRASRVAGKFLKELYTLRHGGMRLYGLGNLAMRTDRTHAHRLEDRTHAHRLDADVLEDRIQAHRLDVVDNLPDRVQVPWRSQGSARPRRMLRS